MPRALRLAPVLVLATAALEIIVFVLVARTTSFGWAVLLVLLASMAGLVLLRREGLRAWRRFRAATDVGAPPGGQATDGVVGLAGSVLLALPGLLTGVIGLLLVLPPGRPIARRWVTAWAERRLPSAAAGDLFGPRRVRVRPGRPYPDPGPARPQDRIPPTPGGTIEGEIIEPR
jgi:UPF0716 protein FxsA